MLLKWIVTFIDFVNKNIFRTLLRSMYKIRPCLPTYNICILNSNATRRLLGVVKYFFKVFEFY